MRAVVSLLLVVAVFVIATLTAAQATELQVKFSCQDCGLDAVEVERAVRAETDPKASGVLSLRVDRRKLTARYSPGQGRELQRQMDLPTDRERAVQSIALLAANLVRDEAADLIAQLRPAASASASASSGHGQAPLVHDTPAASASASASSGHGQAPLAHGTPAASSSAPLAHGAPARVPEPKLQPLNLSLVHPVSLYPGSHRRSFAIEVGLVFGRVGEIHGVAVTSGVTWIQYRLRGVSVAAGASIVGPDSAGLEVSNINFAQEGFQGLQVGTVNMATRRLRGAQVATANLAMDGFQGLQTAPLNIATGSMTGAQVGVVNWAGKVKGTQIGVINIADEVEGYPLGLLNFNRTGRMQLQVWLSAPGGFNYGLRYLHRWFYWYYAGGLYSGIVRAINDKDGKVAWLTGLGARVGIWGDLHLEVDAGYAHEGTLSRDVGHTHVARYRMMLGYQHGRWPGPFVGMGMRHEFPEEGSARSRPEFVFGGVFF